MFYLTITQSSFSASVPILISPPSNLTALDGKDATISCTAEGAPAPNITWFFNGELSTFLLLDN